MFKKRVKNTPDKFRTKNPKKKIVMIVILSLVVICLGIGTWVGASAYRAISKVTSPSSGHNNLLSLIKANNSSTLLGQNDGRTNILLLGMGGGNHPGANLSDTMEVLSIDWKTNQLAMISVPRDLEVQIPGHGYDKINAANADGGGELSSKVVSQILGIPIHYYITLNFSGFVSIIDSVGGIDINVPQAIYDPMYPAYDNGPYTLFKLSAGEHHLTGAVALQYARSRETTSDFDRAKRQQMIMEALKTKFLSLNFLTNPVKVTSLLNTLGNNLRMTLSVNESYALWTEIKGIDTNGMITKVLDDSADNVLTDQSNSLGYVLIPKKGLNDYSDLQTVAQNIFTVTTNINPTITVINGSGKAGQATIEANILKTSYGYSRVTVKDTIKTAFSSVLNCSGISTQTAANNIAQSLGITAQTGTSCGNGDIQITLGQDILTVR